VWWWGSGSSLVARFLGFTSLLFSPGAAADAFYASQSDLLISPLSWQWFVFYAWDSFCFVSPVLFAAFVVGLCLLIARRAMSSWALIATWLGVPYLIFTLISVKEIRHFLPSLPALAIVSGMGLSLLEGRRKNLIVGAVILAGVAQLLVLSHLPLAPGGVLDVLVRPRPLEGGMAHVVARPGDGSCREVAARLAGRIEQEFAGAGPPVIGVVEYPRPYLEDLEALKLEYLLRLRLPGARVHRPFFDSALFWSDFPNMEFLVVVTDEDPPLSWEGLRLTRERKRVEYLDDARFGEVARALEGFRTTGRPEVLETGVRVYLFCRS